MAIAIKKTAAIAIAAGLTFAGSAGIAAQDALAQTTATAAPAAATVDDSKTGSISIAKKFNPTEYRSGTGETDTEVNGKPLSGATFKVTRLKADITDQAVFNELAGYTKTNNVKSATEKYPATGTTADNSAASGETGADGTVKFSDLKLGVYLVEETAPKAGAGETYVPSEPFLVFLPMTNSTGKGWNYDVQLYPKNSYAKATKAVVDEDQHVVGDNKTVTYTLTGIVPAAPAGQKLDWFGLRDAYNSDEITPDTKNLTVKVVSTDGERTLEPGEYTVGVDEKYGTVDKNLAQGANAGFFVAINKPQNLKANDKVVVTVNAELLDGANNDQQIENSVREYFRASTDDANFEEVPPQTPPGDTPPGDTPPDETPNHKVVTYVGNITVYKRGEEQKALEGAEFSIGKCNAKKDAIDGKAIAKGTTDREGKLEFKGLHVTDYVNDADVATDDRDTYCVTETKAPAGYALPKNATQSLTLTREDHFGLKGKDATAKFEAVADGKVIENGVVIDNVKNSVPLLPSTGGMGVLIIALAGLAIIGGGVYAARRNSQSA